MNSNPCQCAAELAAERSEHAKALDRLQNLAALLADTKAERDDLKKSLDSTTGFSLTEANTLRGELAAVTVERDTLKRENGELVAAKVTWERAVNEAREQRDAALNERDTLTLECAALEMKVREAANLAAQLHAHLQLGDPNKPLPDADGWITHDGRDPGLEPDTPIEFVRRGDSQQARLRTSAGRLDWKHRMDYNDIIKYRIVKDTQ